MQCNPLALIFIADTVQRASSFSFGQGHLSTQIYIHTQTHTNIQCMDVCRCIERWRVHKEAQMDAHWDGECTHTHTHTHTHTLATHTCRIVDAGSWFPIPRSGVTVIYDWEKIQGKNSQLQDVKTKRGWEGEKVRKRKGWTQRQGEREREREREREEKTMVIDLEILGVRTMRITESLKSTSLQNKYVAGNMKT